MCCLFSRTLQIVERVCSRFFLSSFSPSLSVTSKSFCNKNANTFLRMQEQIVHLIDCNIPGMHNAHLMTFFFASIIVVVVIFVVGEVKENANHLKLLPSSAVYKAMWMFILSRKSSCHLKSFFSVYCRSNEQVINSNASITIYRFTCVGLGMRERCVSHFDSNTSPFMFNQCRQF